MIGTRPCVVCGKSCEWHGRYAGEEFTDQVERWACCREHAWEALMLYGTPETKERIARLVAEAKETTR